MLLKYNTIQKKIKLQYWTALFDDGFLLLDQTSFRLLGVCAF